MLCPQQLVDLADLLLEMLHLLRHLYLRQLRVHRRGCTGAAQSRRHAGRR